MDKELIQYFGGDELAANVWLTKYAQKGEKTPNDMHKRMAKEFVRIEEKYIELEKKYYEDVSFQGIESLSEYCLERENLTNNKIYNLFKDFKYIIPQGSIMSQLGSESIGSLSNCFVIGQPEDSYGGIFQKDQQIAQLSKRRGGVGMDISKLRPVGTETNNAAKSSTGAVSFMNRFSSTIREVAQNGRRGALMISMHINHPDILEFIKVKRDLTKITGANISIKLSNEFMEAVQKDKDYFLKFPYDSEYLGEKTNLEYNITTRIESIQTKEGYIYVKKIKAKEYWDEIIKSAHGSGEPGLIFEDNHHEYSPDGVYKQYKGVTTNPCGEIFMQKYDACRLIAVNLFSFVDNPFTSKAIFNYKKFYKYNYEAMRLSDDLIDLEVEHINRILKKIYDDPENWTIKRSEFNLWNKIRETTLTSRRTGLGFTALGDMLAALNIKYGSSDSLYYIDRVMKTKMRSELDCTIDLGILRGTFKGWDRELEAGWIPEGDDVGENDFYGHLYLNFEDQWRKMSKYGRRNVSWSTVAPTGSLSMLAQVTSGIEPLFMPFYTRRKKINIGDTEAKVDFTDNSGDNWSEYTVLHTKFKDWITLTYPHWIESDVSKRDLEATFIESPWFEATANDINWEDRVKVQALIQKYISHSISSTVNLPNDIDLDTVSNIYLKAWEEGLKGITVYRDGSRAGVLIPTKEKISSKFGASNSIKRPREVIAEAHTTIADGESFSIFVGLINGNPYETFGYAGKTIIGRGHIIKENKGEYYFVGDGDNSRQRILTDKMTPEQKIVTRLVSRALRHGSDIKYIVEDLNKEGGLFSFNGALAKVLKKYIPNGVTGGDKKCESCGDPNGLHYEEGCLTCKSCGFAKCG